jgi:glyceraldehyde 3-phosphate dehydrogenase
MEQIGLIAESVRIPNSTGSLIILVINLQDELSGEEIQRDLINNIYRQAASADSHGYLLYTDKQNVSGDIIGQPRAAAIIEGHETHRRTAEVTIELGKIPGLGEKVLSSLNMSILKVPVTQAVIYGWYDNEMGSYVNILGDRTVSVAENL